MNGREDAAHPNDGIPFVGRRRELDRLAGNDDDPPHRVIVGGPGVGRSRLLVEHAARMTALGWTTVPVTASGPPLEPYADPANPAQVLLLVDDLSDLPTPIRRVIDEVVARGRDGLRVVAVAAPATRPEWPVDRHLVLELHPLGPDELGELLAHSPWSNLFATDLIAPGPDPAPQADDDTWESALASGERHRIARAALGTELRFGYVGARAAEAGRRALEALRRLDDTEPALRARLLARRALGHLGDADTSQARDLAEQALSSALATDDRRALGEALVAYSVTDLGPDTLDERLAMAHRVLAIAAELDAADLADLGRFLLLGALLESGDIGAIDAELALVDRSASSAEGRGSARHVAWFRAMRALLEGRVEDAETRAAEALEVARSEEDDDADSVYFGQLGIIRWLQGREDEMEPLYLGAREQQPHAAVWRGVLARLWALQGRNDLAGGVLVELADFGGIPRDRNWLLTMCVLAEAAALLDDQGAAEALRAELLPYAARLVPIGTGIACFGSVARALGLLASTLGRHDEAEHHLRTAIRVCSAAGARPWLAQAQLDLAAQRTSRGLPDDGLAAEAAATIRATGVAVLHRPSDSTLVESDATLSSTRSNERRPVVRVLGTFEVVDADGERATWTSRKARELLKILVTRRGAATTRESLIGILWPDDRVDEASNRLSVAISTARRALDPGRRHPSSRFVASDGDAVRLVVSELEIDVLDFLDLARSALAVGDPATRRERLRAALDAYPGPALSDEPDAEWAAGLRLEASGAFLAVARRLGEDSLGDDPLLAAETFRRILAEDPYDDGGHRGLVSAFDSLGAHGRSEAARRSYYAHMAEIGLDVDRVRGRPALARPTDPAPSRA